MASESADPRAPPPPARTPRTHHAMILRPTAALLLVAGVPALVAQGTVDPLGRSILFIRGADGSGGLGSGSVQRRTEHLSDINNTSTTPGNHGFGELAALLRTNGFTVTQWIESQGALTLARLIPHRIVVLASNNRVYQAAEVAAFHSYMDAGGSALFISDANWGPNFNAAPASDNQFMARYGLTMYQDSANGVPVMSRASAGRYVMPGHHALSGRDGSGGVDDVQSFDGEGVSYIGTGPGSNGWKAWVIVSALGFQVRQLNASGPAGRLVNASARDGAIVKSQNGDGLVIAHFDRNTFFNANGTGTNLSNRDNRLLALNLFRGLASVPPYARLAGVPCSRAARTPRLSMSFPHLGTLMQSWLNGGESNALVGLLLAPGKPTPRTIPGGCVVQPDLATAHYHLIGTTDGQGRLMTPFQVPTDHALVGVVLTAQMVLATPGGPAYGVAELTNGIELRIGLLNR